ncbi:Phox homologous domain [Pseudocohnilembus persalinus]|uniref:Phox homologous domain n=1 Tax=Pseudocohnilembus persalinus TaxID=266149 RepID=A0A0V0R8W3_PSEPJ|nr:Phox homologous domain [Pseudocohnilembus persalinus]|eukprot:KRX10816.1 Phox homologous domain [Pseudocohnilembus persalinus]
MEQFAVKLFKQQQDENTQKLSGQYLSDEQMQQQQNSEEQNQTSDPLEDQKQEQQQESQNEDQNQNKNEEKKQEEAVQNQQQTQKKKMPEGFEIDSLIQCKQLALSEFYKQDITIAVDGYEKVSGGFFGADYIVYKIKTFPFNWDVSRRYSDFYALRNVLLKLYPANIVPPITRRNKGKRNLSKSFVQKRLSILEKFLQKLVKCPELKGCPYIQRFLETTNEKEFKNLIREMEKVKEVHKLEEIRSIDGLIQSKLDKDINIYCQKSQEYYHHSDLIYKKIRQLSKQLFVDFYNVSNTLANIGECFSQLHDQSQTFNQGLTKEEDKQPLLEEMYITLNNMNIQWGETLQSQMDHVQKNLQFFFKYYNQEGRQVKETLKTRDETTKKYYDYKKKLNDKKERYFNLQNLQQWDLPSNCKYTSEQLKSNKELAFTYMLQKERNQEQDLREKAGYYSKAVYEDLKRIMNEKVQEYSIHFKSFGSLQTDNIQKLHFLWADILGSLDQLGKGNKKMLMQQKKIQESADDFLDEN